MHHNLTHGLSLIFLSNALIVFVDLNTILSTTAIHWIIVSSIAFNLKNNAFLIACTTLIDPPGYTLCFRFRLGSILIISSVTAPSILCHHCWYAWMNLVYTWRWHTCLPCCLSHMLLWENWFCQLSFLCHSLVLECRHHVFNFNISNILITFLFLVWHVLYFWGLSASLTCGGCISYLEMALLPFSSNILSPYHKFICVCITWMCGFGWIVTHILNV